MKKVFELAYIYFLEEFSLYAFLFEKEKFLNILNSFEDPKARDIKEYYSLMSDYIKVYKTILVEPFELKYIDKDKMNSAFKKIKEWLIRHKKNTDEILITSMFLIHLTKTLYKNRKKYKVINYEF